MIHHLLLYFGCLNVLAGYVFWLDWRYEKEKLGIGKIPEGSLLILGFAGGALGICFMQKILRHRLYRRRFQIRQRLYILAQISILVINAQIPTLLLS